MKPFLILTIILALAGCGGGPDVGQSTGGGSGGASGGLGGDVGIATAPFLVFDLASGRVTGLRSSRGGAPPVGLGRVLFRRISGHGEDYFLGVYELSQRQWTMLAGSTPWTGLVPAPAWYGTAVADDKPAFNLSHDAITTALAAYNAGRKSTLALPSDSQWTYACAAGSNATWSWGGTTGAPAALAALAVVRESQLGVIGPRRVGSTQANGFGLFDMHGNVWEWTSEQHVRGGSWHDPAWTARTANQAGGIDADLAINEVTAHALVGVRLILRP